MLWILFAALTLTSNAKDCSEDCCKCCTTGKACGNTCISQTKTCTAAAGCACNSEKTAEPEKHPDKPKGKPSPEVTLESGEVWTPDLSDVNPLLIPDPSKHPGEQQKEPSGQGKEKEDNEEEENEEDEENDENNDNKEAAAPTPADAKKPSKAKAAPQPAKKEASAMTKAQELFSQKLSMTFTSRYDTMTGELKKSGKKQTSGFLSSKLNWLFCDSFAVPQVKSFQQWMSNDAANFETCMATVDTCKQLPSSSSEADDIAALEQKILHAKEAYRRADMNEENDDLTEKLRTKWKLLKTELASSEQELATRAAIDAEISSLKERIVLARQVYQAAEEADDDNWDDLRTEWKNLKKNLLALQAQRLPAYEKYVRKVCDNFSSKLPAACFKLMEDVSKIVVDGAEDAFGRFVPGGKFIFQAISVVTNVYMGVYDQDDSDDVLLSSGVAGLGAGAHTPSSAHSNLLTNDIQMIAEHLDRQAEEIEKLHNSVKRVLDHLSEDRAREYRLKYLRVTDAWKTAKKLNQKKSKASERRKRDASKDLMKTSKELVITMKDKLNTVESEWTGLKRKASVFALATGRRADWDGEMWHYPEDSTESNREEMREFAHFISKEAKRILKDSDGTMYTVATKLSGVLGEYAILRKMLLVQAEQEHMLLPVIARRGGSDDSALQTFGVPSQKNEQIYWDVEYFRKLRWVFKHENTCETPSSSWTDSLSHAKSWLTDWSGETLDKKEGALTFEKFSLVMDAVGSSAAAKLCGPEKEGKKRIDILMQAVKPKNVQMIEDLLNSEFGWVGSQHWKFTQMDPEILKSHQNKEMLLAQEKKKAASEVAKAAKVKEEAAALVASRKKANKKLNFAAKVGNLENVKEAIENGADIRLAGHGGASALGLATNAGHHDVVTYLKSIGAAFSEIEISEKIAKKEEETRAAIDQAKAAVDQANKDLIIAATMGNLEDVKTAVVGGAEVNYHVDSSAGVSVLGVATTAGHDDIVKYLIEVGAAFSETENGAGWGWGSILGYCSVAFVLVAGCLCLCSSCSSSKSSKSSKSSNSSSSYSSSSYSRPAEHNYANDFHSQKSQDHYRDLLERAQRMINSDNHRE